MASWSCTVAAAVLIAVPVLAAAQGVATPPAPQPVYRSVFEGYRAFTDEPVRPWRETNDTVGRIGGWKAYAREAPAPDARPAAASASSAPASMPTGGGHSTHHAPAQP